MIDIPNTTTINLNNILERRIPVIPTSNVLVVLPCRLLPVEERQVCALDSHECPGTA